MRFDLRILLGALLCAIEHLFWRINEGLKNWNYRQYHRNR